MRVLERNGDKTARLREGRRMMQFRDIWQQPIRLDEPGADGIRRSWIMLMPQGEFSHPDYGEIHFSRDKLLKFKHNFDHRVRKIDIALDADHRAAKDETRATGWIEQLELRGSDLGGLYGLIGWTPYGVQLLNDREYRYFSPEFGNYTDEETGENYEDVIIGGALTNRPFLKVMPSVKLRDRARRAGVKTALGGRGVAEETIKLMGGSSRVRSAGSRSSKVTDYNPANIDDATAYDDSETDDESTMDDGGSDDDAAMDDAETDDDAAMDDSNPEDDENAEDDSDEGDGSDDVATTTTTMRGRGRGKTMSGRRMAARSKAMGGGLANLGRNRAKPFASAGRGKSMSETNSEYRLRVQLAEQQNAIEEQRRVLAEQQRVFYDLSVDKVLEVWRGGKTVTFAEQTLKATNLPRGTQGDRYSLGGAGKRFRQARVALTPLAEKKIKAFLMSDGTYRMSDTTRNNVMDLIQTLLSESLVELGARGGSMDMDARQTVRGGVMNADERDTMLMEAAEAAAAQDRKRLSELTPEEKLKYFQLAEQAIGYRG